jgi:hypothetical protein
VPESVQPTPAPVVQPTAAAFASPTLDALVNAAASFPAAIQEQLEMVQSSPSPAELAEKTIDYVEAKTTYFHALRAAMPELMSIATGKEARSPAVDKFAKAFSVAGEKQAIRAEYETRVLLERFSGGSPGVSDRLTRAVRGLA